MKFLKLKNGDYVKPDKVGGVRILQYRLDNQLSDKWEVGISIQYDGAFYVSDFDSKEEAQAYADELITKLEAMES